MGFIPKSLEQLEEELSLIESHQEEVVNFFRILTSNPISAKELSKIVDINKYDEITKDFGLIHYYVSFERRRIALYNIDYIDELTDETYDEYLSAGNDPVSEKEYAFDKSEKIVSELMELFEPVTQILAGDGAYINDDDMECAAFGTMQDPIKVIDMKSIAFANRRNGLFGGMHDESINEIINKVINGSPDDEHINKLQEIPEGYGWPTIGLNQRVWAEIDVNTPDDILIEAFKNWLSDTRKMKCLNEGDRPYHLFSEGNVKASHINKWYPLRLLAYLDVKIIEKITNSKLTMKNIGDIIYADQYDVDTTEKVRKTLIPMVNEVMAGGYLNNLLKKALSERL